jgi:ferrous iron transport protein A
MCSLVQPSDATMLLADLPPDTPATVVQVSPAGTEMDAGVLRRLAELGFLPGEPVNVVQRGPGGREPLAVLVGDTLFALRLLEARCVQVSRSQP